MSGLASNDFHVLALILLFPLIGAFINGILGHKLPKQIVWAVACVAVGLSFVFSLMTATSMVRSSRLVPGDVEAGQTSVVLKDTPAYRYEVYTWITSGDYAEPSEDGETAGLEVGAQHERAYVPSDTVTQTGIAGARARVRGHAQVFSGIDIGMGLAVDALSVILLLIITGVGFLIHLYSVGYMRHDKSKARYFAYLNLFVFSMLLLVLGDNMVVMFVGWEGVGVCSYLLIGYYYESHANADAGKKAFIVNRVGDFAFILGMLTLFFWFGTLNFSELEVAITSGAGGPMQGSVLALACILLFIGCTGKSAQIPLYVWLPDAMAGPTPVSALIHAATMVTAGIYLIVRLHFAFIEAPAVMMVVACVGALTAFFAATIAITQTDIKKVLAYSTVSQLGYMFLAVGVGAWWAAVFHLMTHAFFKALLFLGSGSVIDAMHHEQDIGKMGGLRKKMPITAATFLIGCLAISGFPLVTSGFYSKDAILWYTWFNQVSDSAAWLHNVLWVIGLMTAGMTAFYMFRLYFRTFEGECRAPEEVRDHITESPISMTLPLVVLAILSVLAGFIGVPHVLNLLHAFQLDALPQWLGTVADSKVPHATELPLGWGIGAWEIILMVCSVAIAFGGIGLAWFLYLKKTEKPAELAEKASGLYKLLFNKYYVDEIYKLIIVRPILAVGAAAHWLTDKILIDWLVVTGSAQIYRSAGKVLKHVQNGELQRYAAYIVLGIAAMMYLVLL